MEVCSECRVLTALHSGKQFPAAGGPQSRCALFGDEKIFLSTPGIELRSVGHFSRNLITTPTELSVTLILYLLSTRLVSHSCSWHSCLLVWRLRVQALLRTSAVVTRYLLFWGYFCVFHVSLISHKLHFPWCEYRIMACHVTFCPAPSCHYVSQAIHIPL